VDEDAPSVKEAKLPPTDELTDVCAVASTVAASSRPEARREVSCFMIGDSQQRAGGL
jgi:hypothetical protein